MSSVRLWPKSTQGRSCSAPGRSPRDARIMSCVPSVEPVSQITQASTRPRTDSRQRSMTAASSFTIMLKQIEGISLAGGFCLMQLAPGLAVSAAAEPVGPHAGHAHADLGVLANYMEAQTPRSCREPRLRSAPRLRVARCGRGCRVDHGDTSGGRVRRVFSRRCGRVGTGGADRGALEL